MFLAQDLRHSRPVAIKVLRPELGAVIGSERFLREIETVARLQHPHILPLYDSGEADGLLYFVMPFVEGETLRERLEREGRLTLADAVAIARDVAQALAHAHGQGIIHRDIKPENILLFGGAAVVADFGIARAVRIAGGGRLTNVGLTLGTPLYMSPEQAAGASDVDAGSDIYSLACVVYEMLAGEPPFTGQTAADVMANHVHARPRPLTALRSSVPPTLSLAVTRALAKRSADRFGSVAAFADALQPTTGEGGAVERRPPLRAAALAAAVLALALSPVLWKRWRPAPLDAAYYLVLPFQHVRGAASALAAGETCARKLGVGLERWEGLRVMSPYIWSGASLAAGTPPGLLESGAAFARARGAGRIVVGETWEEGGIVHLRAGVYDARRPHQGPLREAVGQFPVSAGPEDVSGVFYRLADDLVVGQHLTPTAAPAAAGTRSVTAWTAFERGDSMLYRWRLDDAETAFRAATAADAGFAHAWLRLAQLALWRGEPGAAFAEDADRAAAASGRLSRRDSLHAAAAAALAGGRFPAACDVYRDLTRSDDGDLFAWFGLAECLRRDRGVLPDGASASGWRFRASAREMLGAYQRALDAAPAVHVLFAGPAYDRLALLLVTRTNVYRSGRAVDDDSQRFGAFPGLDHDTLAYVPQPLAGLLGGVAGADPPGFIEAIRRQRAELERLTERWVRAVPDAPDAWEARALSLEASGRVGGEGPGGALEAVRTAWRLSGDEAQRARLGQLETRLLVKRGDFAAAARRADALLTGMRPEAGAGAGAGALAGVAALRGRIALAARSSAAAAADTLALPSGEPVVVPRDLALLAARLETYAAFDATRDSVRSLAAAVQAAIPSYVPAPARPAVAWALLSLPLGMAWDDLHDVVAGRGEAGGDYVLAWRMDVAAGRPAAARRALQDLDALRERVGLLPGDVEIDGVLHEARLQLVLGDTAGAMVRLDRTLGALPMLSPFVLDRVAPAAALVRVMALRAELAAARGDGATARRWAAAVRTLWNGADPALRVTLQRMRQLEDN